MDKKSGLDGSAVKWIAMITMFIDHVGAGFVARYMNANHIAYVLGGTNPVCNLYTLMRQIGRMAFPIYIFFLVEGFSHTKSRHKYAIRLLILAIISEIPFDLLFQISDKALSAGKFIEFSGQNVFFELCLGVCMFSVAEFAVGKFRKINENEYFLQAVFLTVTLVFALIARYILRSDYGFNGILAMGIMYLFKDRKKLGAALMCMSLIVLNWYEVGALLCLFPLYLYNGQRGKQSKIITYGFYPVHLLAIWIFTFLMGYIVI